MINRTALTALALLFAGAASAASLDTDNEESLTEVDRTFTDSFLSQPSPKDTLPRVGAPGAPVSSSTAVITLQETDDGRCATFGVPARDLVHARVIDPNRKLYSGDVTLTDSKGTTLTDVIHLESDDLDDPPIVPYLLLNGGDADITLCVPDGSSEVTLRMESVLPNSVLVASATGGVAAGEDIRVEARLAGLGLRSAPTPIEITATANGTEIQLYDVGTKGDAEAGDGIYTGTLTAPTDSDRLDIVVQAEGLEGDLTLFRTAEVSTAVLSDGGGIDRDSVTAAADYIRVPLDKYAEEGGRIHAFFGIGDSLLSEMSVNVGKDSSGFVAFVPRWGASKGADRVVLRYVPADPAEASDTATFTLP